MDLLYQIFIDPFVQMVQVPDLFVQTLWEGLVSGVLYALIALGFVLIFKASGVFNFAQGIMVVFAALTLIGIYTQLRGWGVRPGDLAAFLALFITVGVMFVLAVGVERLMLRPLVNQPDIILFMATFGLTYFLIGLGELVFGGEPKVMIADDLHLQLVDRSGAGDDRGPRRAVPEIQLLRRLRVAFEARTHDRTAGLARPLAVLETGFQHIAAEASDCLV